MSGSYWTCGTCGGRIIMARCAGLPELLDYTPDEDGDHAAGQTAAGAWIARVLIQGEQPRPPEHRYRRHYDSSPQCRPAAPEQRAAVSEVSDFLGDWRKARSANEAAKRNRRGRRKPAQTYPGFRRNP